MTQLPEKQAVLFDMDGTILDSMYMWRNLGEIYLKNKGRAVPDDFRSIVEKKTPRESTAWMKETFGLTESLDEIEKELFKLAETYYEEKLELKPGVKEFLDQCMMKRMRMAVVTTTPERFARKALARLGVLNYFYFIMDCDLIPGGKTRPDAYQMASHRLAASPQSTIVFEDAAFAMKTAKSVGYYVVGVADEYELAPRSELVTLCDKFITSFTELL